MFGSNTVNEFLVLLAYIPVVASLPMSRKSNALSNSIIFFDEQHAPYTYLKVTYAMNVCNIYGGKQNKRFSFF